MPENKSPPEKKKTLYDVLGVPREAKATDITRAYKRITAQLASETAAPDARLAARAKVAYETLSDPARRDEYDESLKVAATKRPERRAVALVGGVAVLVAAAVVASMYATRAKEEAASEPLPPEQILALGEQLVSPMEETRISGEIAQTGVAVATAKHEMVTPCHTLAAGAQIMVGFGAKAARADMARADPERDICMLRVKDSNDAVAKLRMTDPAPGERVYTVVLGGAKPTQLREGHVTRAIPDAPGGKAYEVVLPGTVPNGSPLLDVRGNVVGIVTVPHAFGQGLTVALAASRISNTLGTEHSAEAAAEAAVAAQPKTSHGTGDDDPQSSSPSSPAAGPRPRNVGEAYRQQDEQRARTLDDEVVRQVNGKPQQR